MHQQGIEPGPWPGSLSRVPHATAGQIRCYGLYGSYVLCSVLHRIDNILYCENLVITHHIGIEWPLCIYFKTPCYIVDIPNNMIHGANMGPTWVLSAPDGPHIGPMIFAIWDDLVMVYKVGDLWCIVWNSYDVLYGGMMIHSMDELLCVVMMPCVQGFDALCEGTLMHCVQEEEFTVWKRFDTSSGRAMIRCVDEERCNGWRA